MILDLKPYPEYEESLPWYGAAPVHWRQVRIKYLLQEFDRRTETGEEPLLSMRREQGIVPLSDYSGKVADPKSLIGYKLVRPGDLVLNRMQANNGLIFVSKVSGVISPDYALFRLIAPADLSFLERLFRSLPMRQKFKAEATGLGTGSAGFLRLYGDTFGAIPILLPQLPEQRQILSVISRAERDFVRLLQGKRRLIGLLNEQKQATIQVAVTRGLGSERPLKPSGAEWLGDVPLHWSLKRFKFIASVSSGQVDPRDPEHRTKILVAPNHIKIGAGTIHSYETAEEQGADSGKYEVRRGQIIYSKIRPNLRKAAIAPVDCLCSADMYALSINEREIRPRYFLLILLSAPFTKYAVDCSMRVAMPKVNREALGECLLWYPPLEEQDAILDSVSAAIAKLDSAIDSIDQEIKAIRELRTRFIADLVTGKVDVRDLARHLSYDLAEPTGGHFDEALIGDGEEFEAGDDELELAEALA